MQLKLTSNPYPELQARQVNALDVKFQSHMAQLEGQIQVAVHV